MVLAASRIETAAAAGACVKLREANLPVWKIMTTLCKGVSKKIGEVRFAYNVFPFIFWKMARNFLWGIFHDIAV